MIVGFDIFCRVIDHFGDAGVCWRLAKQLAGAPYLAPVRLWVDDLSTLARLAPEIDPLRPYQKVNQIEVVHWGKPLSPGLSKLHPYPVVIEAFAGGLPTDIRQQLGSKNLWIVLDHLSAEHWVDQIHGRANTPNPQPERYFFFAPGFSPHTGGLLRETGLLRQIKGWQQLPKALQWQQLANELQLSTPLVALLSQPQTRSYFIFQYPHAPVSTLLQHLRQKATPSVVLLAADQQLPSPKPITESMLKLIKIPFIRQETFDHLLWSCDLNFVRGEDSWIRALWAQKPFIWQPYPQSQGSHRIKLEAWLKRLSLPYAAQQLQRRWVIAAEHPQPDRYLRPQDFHALETVELTAWQKQLQRQVYRWQQQPPLAQQLINFCHQQLATAQQ